MIVGGVKWNDADRYAVNDVPVANVGTTFTDEDNPNILFLTLKIKTSVPLGEVVGHDVVLEAWLDGPVTVNAVWWLVRDVFSIESFIVPSQ